MVGQEPQARETDPRAVGPVFVWAGSTGAPVVLVLDPAGEAKHDDVPPTWADLAAQRQVGWCRVSTEGALTEAEELLGDPSALGSPIDIVTSGPASLVTLDLASRHRNVLRAVLFVDPDTREVDHGGEPAAADDRLDEHESARRRELEAAGVTVRVVARSFVGDRDRIDPPLPLGHPDVAEAVGRTIAELDSEGD